MTGVAIADLSFGDIRARGIHGVAVAGRVEDVRARGIRGASGSIPGLPIPDDGIGDRVTCRGHRGPEVVSLQFNRISVGIKLGLDEVAGGSIEGGVYVRPGN